MAEIGTFQFFNPLASFVQPGYDVALSGPNNRYNVVKPRMVPSVGTPLTAKFETAVMTQHLNAPGTYMLPPTWFEDTWWELGHILPRLEQDVGNVISEQVIDVELHNADRYGPMTITSITDNLGAGIFISGVPSTPFQIKPQRSIKPTITIERSGDLVIDASYTFHDSEGTEYTVQIVGSRIVMFPVRPESPFNETMQFQTEVLTKINGTEQRRSLIKSPRTEFAFTIKGPQNRQQAEFALFDRQAKAIALPMWHEPAFLSDATVPAGTTVINVTQTAYRNFFVGGYAVILQDEFTYDAIEIVAMDATSVTAKSGIENTYDGRVATLMPMALSYFPPQVSGTKQYRDAETLKIRMSVDAFDNDIADASAWNTFNGKVLLDDPNLMPRSGLQSDMETKVYDHTTVGSLIYKYAIWDKAKTDSIKGFKTDNRQQLWEVRQLLHYLRGQQQSFYIPTFMEEITPTANLINANSSLQMRNIGYTRNVRNRFPKNYLLIHLTNGNMLEREVVGSAEQDKDYEQLTVDTPWPYDIALDEIDYIDFITKVRLNVDEVTIMHYNALGQAKCNVPIKEVFD